MVRIFKILFIPIYVFVVLTLGAQVVYASTLNFLGIGWNKTEVTVLIKAAGGISSQAVVDVETAVSDWNNVRPISAPTFTLITDEKRADIVIHMKVGGGAVLGYTALKTISPFSCVVHSVRIQLSGKAFGENFSSAGIRNVARHELGHALGLEHSDYSYDLMYTTADSSEIFGNTDVGISPCDIVGIDAIYPLPQFCGIENSITCSP